VEIKSFNKLFKNSNLQDTREFYFQQCSIEANIQQMATLAATLANGGENPITGEKIFDPFHVRNCLSLMLTCGMYDYSGEWCFTVGLPAKSGVAGCVWCVIPNKMGIATFSPPLDDNGNSVKGIEV
jgi:glutaminase